MDAPAAQLAAAPGPAVSGRSAKGEEHVLEACARPTHCGGDHHRSVYSAPAGVASDDFGTDVAARLGSDPVNQAAELRAAFGLPADVATVERLLDGDGRVGLVETGIPLTQDELANLQLDERMQWQVDLQDELLPYVQTLPTFGGYYFDQTNNGRLTIILTEDSAAVRSQISVLTPDRSRGVDVILGRFTKAQLVAAAEAGVEYWAAREAEPVLISMAVKTARNAIQATVAARDVDQAAIVAAEVEQLYGVPVTVAIGESPVDTACTDRDHCTPLRGGIRIAKGDTTVNDCTMAFHVTLDGNVSFSTAGHCGYSGNNCWYHEGYDGPNGRRIGCEIDTMLENNGHDIMTVGMFDDQATEWIYGTTISDIAGYYLEQSGDGAVVKASRGASNVVSTGTVSDGWVSWVSTTSGDTVWGLDTNLPSNLGDSGSPVFVDSAVDLAIGSLCTSSGQVSYFDSLNNHFGYGLYGVGS